MAIPKRQKYDPMEARALMTSPMGGAPKVVTGTSAVKTEVDDINDGLAEMDTTSTDFLLGKTTPPLTAGGMDAVAKPDESAVVTKFKTDGYKSNPDGTYTSPDGLANFDATGNYLGSNKPATEDEEPETPATPAPKPPAFGQYSSAEERRISEAGSAAGGEFDPLIAKAERDKKQGMAKNVVAAGERGGFMNSQFAGQAAISPINAENFIGTGGELNRIQSEYDFNISQLEVQKINSIKTAKSAMEEYIDTGKQQDFNNARAAYQDAKAAEKSKSDLESQKITDQLNMQKLHQTLNSPIEGADATIQSAAMELITKYPEVVQLLSEAGISPYELTYAELAQAVSMTEAYQQEKTKGSFGSGMVGEYEYMKSLSPEDQADFIAYQNSDANRKAKASGSAGLTPFQLVSTRNTIEDNLRGNPSVKSYGELVASGIPTVIDRFNKGQTDSVADTIMMRALAKITDPTTGVREEEYRTFEGAIGALNRAFTIPKSWIGKGRLNDTGRAQMVREIQERFEAREKDYISNYNYYQNQAAGMGLSIPPPFEVSGVSAETTLMTGPDGIDYDVPNAQVDAFIAEGGKRK